MRVEVTPDRLVVEAGVPVVLTATVTNTGTVIAAYQVSVLGVDTSWVQVDQPTVHLFPDASEAVALVVTLPAGVPAGTRDLTVQVSDATEPGRVELVPVALEVAPRSAAHITLDPVTITAGSRASFGAIVRNGGNTPLRLRLEATDDQGRGRFSFEPPVIELPPGGEGSVAARVRARRPLAGSPRILPFTVTAAGAEPPPQALGTLVQRPLLSRGLLSLGGLLLAVTVFAAVITASVSEVLARSEADRNMLLQVIQAEEGQHGAPGAVAGQVTDLATGQVLSGVAVEAYDVTDMAGPAAAAATAADGSYRLDGLPVGDYKLRFRSAGFVEVWYPTALTPEDAVEVEVTAGGVTDRIAVRMGGQPGSIAGTVLGEELTGVEVVLRVPGVLEADGPDGALVATAPVDGAGTFAFPEVPSPSTYEVVARMEGFAEVAQVVEVGAGQSVSGVELALRRGDGVISGLVQVGDQPEGGVEVEATDGVITSRTVSLTRGAPGTFTLRDLPTPGTYTLTFSKEGFTTETVQVTLAAGQERTGLDVALRGGAGSISGRVAVQGQGASGGVLVTVTDGELVLTTTTLSLGQVGSWLVGGLPVPGTYTVTFSRADLRSQTRQVHLDPFGGRDAEGVDATLQPGTALVRGRALEAPPPGSGAAPRPLGGATVSLTAGDRSYETTSSSVDGRFEVGNIIPGTYTITVARAGSQSVSQLVTLGPGDLFDTRDVTIQARAAIGGTVRREGTGAPVPGATVRLYPAATYPTGLVQTVTAGPDGSYLFTGLDAPLTYVVEAAATATGAPQGSALAPVNPGEQRTVAAGNPVDVTIP